jgi:hypothetical protein
MSQISYNDKIAVLVKFKKIQEVILIVKRVVDEAYTFKEFISEMRILIKTKNENFIIKRQVFWDKEFDCEIDIDDNAVFLLEDRQIIIFYLEESIADSVSKKNLDK